MVSNRSYGVLFKVALDAPLWSKVANVSEQPTNGVASVVHLNPGGNAGFYRIVTPPMPCGSGTRARARSSGYR